MCLKDTALAIAEDAISIVRERETAPDIQERIKEFVRETRERLDLLERVFGTKGD